MSTRSRIGYCEDGVVKSVYCHSDGYLEYNGRVLFENYNNLDAVKELVALGGISFLGESLDYLDEDHKNGTRDYYRWRGEPVRISVNQSINDYFDHAFDSWEEFAYLFLADEDHRHGRWVYKEHYMHPDCAPFDLEADLREFVYGG